MQAQLIIELSDDGTVRVGGPIDNKILCYGLLECARDAIREHNEKRTAPRIVPATVLPMGRG